MEPFDSFHVQKIGRQMTQYRTTGKLFASPCIICDFDSPFRAGLREEQKVISVGLSSRITLVSSVSFSIERKGAPVCFFRRYNDTHCAFACLQCFRCTTPWSKSGRGHSEENGDVFARQLLARYS